jgi:hypothetical protein
MVVGRRLRHASPHGASCGYSLRVCRVRHGNEAHRRLSALIALPVRSLCSMRSRVLCASKSNNKGGVLADFLKWVGGVRWQLAGERRGSFLSAANTEGPRERVRHHRGLALAQSGPPALVLNQYAHSRKVCTRTIETGYEPAFDRVTGDKHDWDRCCCPLRRERGRNTSPGGQNGNSTVYQFRSK